MDQYLQEYKEFLSSYRSGVTTAEDVGKMIAKMAQHYCDANNEYAEAEIKYNGIAASFEGTSDGSTGKPISSAKAKVLTDSTTESSEFIKKKRKVENIEQIIGSLKSLQKGLMAEQFNSSVM